MKKHILHLGILGLALGIISCESETINDQIPNLAELQVEIDDLTNTATSNPWIVTNFVDSGKNETADFSGYGFSFNADGSIVADNGVTIVNGTWSITIDNDVNDDSQDDDSYDSNDDDYDDNYDDDCSSCNVEQLTEILTGCTEWEVSKLERAGNNDLEDVYVDYYFNFLTDGTVTVTYNTESFSGTWEASGMGNNIEVILTIDNLNDIPDTWILHEIERYSGETNIDLRIGDDRLRFKNSCTFGDFNEGETTGEIDFNIFFSAPVDFAELSEDWNIVSYTATKIELIHQSGGNGDTDLLTFEKQ